MQDLKPSTTTAGAMDHTTVCSPLTRAILRTAFDKAREAREAALDHRDLLALVIAARACSGSLPDDEQIAEYRAAETAADTACEISRDATDAFGAELRKPHFAWSAR